MFLRSGVSSLRGAQVAASEMRLQAATPTPKVEPGRRSDMQPADPAMERSGGPDLVSKAVTNLEQSPTGDLDVTLVRRQRARQG